MRLKELGSVCDLQNGFAFKSDDYVDFSETVSLRMSNIRPGGNFDNNYNLRYLPDSFREEYSNYLIQEGDLVIAMTDLANDPKILGIPTIVETGEKTWLLNQRAGKLIVKDSSKADKNYLRYILNHPIHRNYYKMFAGGGLQINVGKKEILGVKIPLPPLKTQQHIAQILDDAAALRDKTKQLLAEYDLLAQAIFLEMFGDPGNNPKGWEKSKTIDYCDCIVPGRDKPKSFSGDIPWVTTNDLEHLNFTNQSKLNIGLTIEEIEQVKAKVIPSGSVIITCVGDLGVVTINNKNMVVNQQLHTFQCSEKINNVFLMYNLSFQKPYMYKMASSTTVPYMNKTISNGIPTILPPIELQNQFAEKIALIEQQKALAKQELQESEDLFNCLLQKAFKGELVFETA
ncbi:MAG TPA: restriction endonuclease subunit S [Dysgonamonadaceae bacterium]|nr:restriction endonuclease subunit S [Dysgonamonadaceae bacterium]